MFGETLLRLHRRDLRFIHAGGVVILVDPAVPRRGRPQGCQCGEDPGRCPMDLNAGERLRRRAEVLSVAACEDIARAANLATLMGASLRLEARAGGLEAIVVLERSAARRAQLAASLSQALLTAAPDG